MHCIRIKNATEYYKVTSKCPQADVRKHFSVDQLASNCPQPVSWQGIDLQENANKSLLNTSKCQHPIVLASNWQTSKLPTSVCPQRCFHTSKCPLGFVRRQLGTSICPNTLIESRDAAVQVDE